MPFGESSFAPGFDRERLLAALKSWVDAHPAPDKPAISIAQGGTYSPRQIYEEVLEDSGFGQFFVRMVEHGAGLAGFEEVLKGFTNIDVAEIDEDDEHEADSEDEYEQES